ncbi:MAG: exostosin family protein [Methanogenium sp.]|jgi:hypothetical protein
MKIYILPVKSEFQPSTISVTYPAHNKGFKDAEELFLSYLQNHHNLITPDPAEADWHYLPILWTHWLVNHKFGTVDLDKLQAEANRSIIDSSKTFTIYEYAEQPKINLGNTIVFLGSRTALDGLDIPLLCAKHPYRYNENKVYKANFVGSLTTHPSRKEMLQKLAHRRDINIQGGGGTEAFVSMMLQSYIALCPRGYGGASYRFYEAMQLGCIPFLIGDIDHRPFKKFLDWSQVSFYTKSINEIERIIDEFDNEFLLQMGINAKSFYDTNLADGNWCKYILKELELLR